MRLESKAEREKFETTLKKRLDFITKLTRIMPYGIIPTSLILLGGATQDSDLINVGMAYYQNFKNTYATSTTNYNLGGDKQ